MNCENKNQTLYPYFFANRTSTIKTVVGAFHVKLWRRQTVYHSCLKVPVNLSSFGLFVSLLSNRMISPNFLKIDCMLSQSYSTDMTSSPGKTCLLATVQKLLLLIT